MSKSRVNLISRGRAPRHGHVFSPPSRAYQEWLAGNLDLGALNQRESGKFFPQTSGGLKDPDAPDDVVSAPPPPDGKIASANQETGKQLDEPRLDWVKHDVKGGEVLDVSWTFAAAHSSRRWSYFITKVDWDPTKVLSRDQFEPEPFFTVLWNFQPFWQYPDELKPPSPTTHAVPLPHREGYHVLLAVWDVADTANAFYHVIDLNFVESGGGGERPTTPQGLTASEVTDRRVVLKWNSSSGPAPIAVYRIIRDGTTSVDIDAGELTWTDNSVSPETVYSYQIVAIDTLGNESLPSTAIEVRTLAEGGEGTPPTAPTNLRSVQKTATSVSMAWNASVGSSAIVNYIVYRDGNEVARVAGSRTDYTDSGLTPKTDYRYFVAALDADQRLSVPSNVLSVQTSEDGGEFPSWELSTFYSADERVSHKGKNWRSLQSHTAAREDWAPGEAAADPLWAIDQR